MKECILVGNNNQMRTTTGWRIGTNQSVYCLVEDKRQYDHSERNNICNADNKKAAFKGGF